ncbi:MAG: response regulator [Desulfobulbaceae bacterium]|nr:response regulator [Desulfobulbaceae bacterium]
MPKKILIVDDSSTMRKIVTRSLRQAGWEDCEIIEAGDGQEALNLLATTAVDLILSDINMPNMDGLEFLRQKATLPAIKNIPVVMITTEAVADTVEKVKELGAKGSIKKPFTPDQIKETLGPLF